MLLGIMDWMKDPQVDLRFQGRPDWAKHFVYGAYAGLGAFRYSIAKAAAYEVEMRHVSQPGNYFDYDDYAASLLGIRWSMELYNSRDKKAYIVKWASGKRLLAALPQLRFGHPKPNERPDGAKLRRIDEYARLLMK